MTPYSILISLRLTFDGHLRVRCPKNLSESELIQLIGSKTLCPFQCMATLGPILFQIQELNSEQMSRVTLAIRKVAEKAAVLGDWKQEGQPLSEGAVEDYQHAKQEFEEACHQAHVAVTFPSMKLRQLPDGAVIRRDGYFHSS